DADVSGGCLQSRDHVVIVSRVEEPIRGEFCLFAPGAGNTPGSLKRCPWWQDGWKARYGRLPMQRRWDNADVNKYRKQALEAAEAAREAAERAADAAGRAAHTAKTWAGPRVKDAKEWAAPRVEHALEDAREWAAPRARGAYKAAARKANPYAKKAGAKAEQWVDYAQGALVGAAIPAVLAAFDRAAEEEHHERRGFPWGAVLIPAVIAGAAGAALVMWAKRDPGRDEWAGDDEW